MNEPRPQAADNTETYDEVLKPMLDKVGKVCRAFDMPALLVIQSKTGMDMDEIRGELFTPNSTAFNLIAASYLIHADGPDDLDVRIMTLANHVLKRSLSGALQEELREVFKSISSDKPEGEDDKEKTVN